MGGYRPHHFEARKRAYEPNDRKNGTISYLADVADELLRLVDDEHSGDRLPPSYVATLDAHALHQLAQALMVDEHAEVPPERVATVIALVGRLETFELKVIEQMDRLREIAGTMAGAHHEPRHVPGTSNLRVDALIDEVVRSEADGSDS